MKRNSRNHYIQLCFLFLFILACDISTNSSEDDQITQKELELKLTEVALQVTQTAMAAPDSSEEEQSDASPPDSEEEVNNGAEDEDPCNSSRMVSESIPDGTNFKAGETFTKSWTLRNAGDCDWTTDYKFVYESGDQMGGKSSMNVPSVIEPGETVTFNIDMTAPTTDGEFTGVWRLKAKDGEKLGKYWAAISVGSANTPEDPDPELPPNQDQFMVTSVDLYGEEDSAGFCPYEGTIWSKIITNNGPGDVTLKISSYPGSEVVYEFFHCGEKSCFFYITTYWPVVEGGLYEIRVEQIEPYYKDWGSISTSVTCLF